MRLYGQAALNACNLGIINVSTECVQHRGVAQLNQTAEQLSFGALRIFAGNLCHTGYIGQTEEATGILAAVYTAQIFYLNFSDCRIFFAYCTGFQRTGKAACISSILYAVALFVGTIHNKTPLAVSRRNFCRMDGGGGWLSARWPNHRVWRSNDLKCPAADRWRHWYSPRPRCLLRQDLHNRLPQLRPVTRRRLVALQEATGAAYLSVDDH